MMVTKDKSSGDENFLKIGFIKKPHGLKGEFKVLPLTDNPVRFKKLKGIFINDDNGYTKYCISSVKITPTDLIVKVDSIDSRDEAEFVRDKYIFIDKSCGEKLGEWEYYSQDLIGCAVFFNEENIGKVVSILNSGANDNLLIKTVDGAQYYYPFLRGYIKEVDINDKKIVINEYEGFFGD